MANVASAEKRNRQRIKRRARNQFHLSTMRTHVKRVRTALASKDANVAAILKAAVAVIDKAAQKGVIDKKSASRKISRLTKSLNRANA
ncbi:MAG TPA: 30S ribosomal protein S20 [Polyangia bacterium]|nr:30S ribosomal protein S20 [Polyangia bacterium]